MKDTFYPHGVAVGLLRRHRDSPLQESNMNRVWMKISSELRRCEEGKRYTPF